MYKFYSPEIFVLHLDQHFFGGVHYQNVMFMYMLHFVAISSPAMKMPSQTHFIAPHTQGADANIWPKKSFLNVSHKAFLFVLQLKMWHCYGIRVIPMSPFLIAITSPGTQLVRYVAAMLLFRNHWYRGEFVYQNILDAYHSNPYNKSLTFFLHV